jgi:apolipoprotein N-acyltransferase
VTASESSGYRLQERASPGREVGRVTAFATYVGDLRGWRRATLAFLSGAASVLAMAPLHVWPILFLTFGFLVWLTDGDFRKGRDRLARAKGAAWTGFWFGFGYFVAGLYWIAEAFLVEPDRHAWLLPFALTGLPAYLALYYAAAAALAALMWRPGLSRAFALAFALGLAELTRSHLFTGLPWNLVGYAFGNSPVLQLSSVVGAYGMTVLALLLFATPATIWAPKGSGLAGGKWSAAASTALILLLGAGYLWGTQRLTNAQDLPPTDLRLRIVQASIDQAEKWRPENSAEIFDLYLGLSRSQGGLHNIDILVWPETALPFVATEVPEAVEALDDLLPPGTRMILGSPRVTRDIEGQRIYNSLFVLDDRAQTVDSYDKMHLVPFGEYLPFQDFMESLGLLQLTGIRGGFSVGKGPRLIEVPGAPQASPLICYEIIFPAAVTEPGTRPGWLVNLTNDAWFGTSAGPYQHLQQARARAVEMGLPVVRAANTGISAVIDSFGEVQSELGLLREGVIDANLPAALPPTFYARQGKAVDLGLLLFIVIGWLVLTPKWYRRNRIEHPPR